MKYYDQKENVNLSIEEINIIQESKLHVLPIVMVDHALVEIFLTKQKRVIIESPYHPIRYGRHCGTRIILQTYWIADDVVDYNPKLIWNGKEWLLSTFANFVFSELEINSKT